MPENALTHAWIAALPLLLLGWLAVHLHPRGSRLADVTWYGPEQRRWAQVSTSLNLGVLLYSATIPLRTDSWMFSIGALLYGVGLLGAIWAYASFLACSDRKLVVTGLYKISRNPIYLFTWLALLAVGVAALSWFFVVLAVLWLVPLHQLTLAEERHCQRCFAGAYALYARHVPRYVSLWCWRR